MRLGVYIDGFNLYYGGRSLFGRGTTGWKWLDVRLLAASLIPQHWQNAAITRVVYCTAVIDQADNPSGYLDQDVYLRALVAHGAVDHIEYGYYANRIKFCALDSDLRYPLRHARTLVPVGLINPSSGRLAGALAAGPTDGVGGHWWHQLTKTDFTNAQMPANVQQLSCPVGW